MLKTPLMRLNIMWSSEVLMDATTRATTEAEFIIDHPITDQLTTNQPITDPPITNHLTTNLPITDPLITNHLMEASDIMEDITEPYQETLRSRAQFWDKSQVTFDPNSLKIKFWGENS